MANWGQVGNQLTQGFQIGQATGGRLKGVGQAIAKVADRLRSQRETGEALQTLGQTERIKQQVAMEYDPEKMFQKKVLDEYNKTGKLPANIKMGALGKLKEIELTDIYDLEEKKRESEFQSKVGAYETAKTVPSPDVSLVRQPQETIRKSLMARGVRNLLEPELGGKKFIRTETGKYKEHITKEKAPPDITLASAVSILSDPLKAMALKKTYPKLYERAEQIVRENLGEDILTKNGSKKILPKPKVKSSIVDIEEPMDTDW